MRFVKFALCAIVLLVSLTMNIRAFPTEENLLARTTPEPATSQQNSLHVQKRELGIFSGLFDRVARFFGESGGTLSVKPATVRPIQLAGSMHPSQSSVVLSNKEHGELLWNRLKAGQIQRGELQTVDQYSLQHFAQERFGWTSLPRPRGAPREPTLPTFFHPTDRFQDLRIAIQKMNAPWYQRIWRLFRPYPKDLPKYISDREGGAIKALIEQNKNSPSMAVLNHIRYERKKLTRQRLEDMAKARLRNS